jgi:hypothetical protein
MMNCEQKIVEAEAVDKPRERFPHDPSAEEGIKKRYVLEMLSSSGGRFSAQASRDSWCLTP